MGLDIRLGEIFKRSFYEFYRKRSGNYSWEPGFDHANSDIVLEWDEIICGLGCVEVVHDIVGCKVDMEDYHRVIHPYRGRLIFVPKELALRVKVLGHLPGLKNNE